MTGDTQRPKDTRLEGARPEEIRDLVLDRVRRLNAVLGLNQPVDAAEVSDLVAHYERLLAGPGRAAEEDLAQLAASSPISASGLADYLDEVIALALIERSTLGTPTARRIRSQTSKDTLAAILHRRGELASPDERADLDAGVARADDARRAAPGRAKACASTVGQVHAYLAGELDDDTAAAIHEHLRTCAGCLQAYGLEAIVTELVATSARDAGQEELGTLVMGRIRRPAAAGLDGSGTGEQRSSAPPHGSPGKGLPVRAGSAPESAAGPGDEAFGKPAQHPSATLRPARMIPEGSRVLILGGDGFCGWPTSLYLSDRGHDVTIVDNLSRRKIDIELEVESLTPIRPINERVRVWREVSGREIGFINLDIATEYNGLAKVLDVIRPDAIVHFAEQRAAPYSMRTTNTKRYTIDNNVRGTHNLLTAMVETGSRAALVHLGTMGVYGYGWFGRSPIPEGYLTVKVPTPQGELEREILHPANPESVYHLSKTLDQLIFSFYASNDGLRITDLHQGIVWGTQTDQTSRDERLINRFDYDGDYGTVLNRFLMQAAIGHPLTVHGFGGQTRAFIHIRDTVRCIEIALANPPESGSRPQVLNQVTETHRVLDLAKMVADLMGADIAYLPNPRQEADENDLLVRNDRFLALGLHPTRLSEGLLEEGMEIAARYRGRADPTKIVCRSVWRVGMETADDLLTELPLL